MSRTHHRGHKGGRSISLPPRMVALVATSIVLLVASVVIYLTELPNLVTPRALTEQNTAGSELDENETENGLSADQEETAENETDENAASENGDEKDDSASSEASPEEEASSPEENDGADTDSPEEEAPTPSTPENPGITEPDAADDIFSSTPSAAEEEAFRSFLSGKASSIPGYASQASACASSFETDSVSASLSVRQSHRGTCEALTQQLFSEYIAVRDYVRSNNSQYCDEQERLIGSYRCLMSYVGCYRDAWNINVSYDDPSGHVGEFSGPLSASGGYLSEFHSYYDGLAI